MDYVHVYGHIVMKFDNFEWSEAKRLNVFEAGAWFFSTR
jgi:hypothetical protein